MFPLFSEFATCAEVPDVYHGWTFYIGDKKEFMPDFNSMDWNKSKKMKLL